VKGQSPNQLLDWHVAVGYEDLTLAGGYNDYDYNDWITKIDGVATLEWVGFFGLREMTLDFTPQARGAGYDHAFHIVIPHGTFGGNGIAVLTLFDKDHNVLSVQTSAFNASADTDFVIFPKTSDVLPTYGNTIEGYPYPPQRFANLTITFSNLAPFSLDSYDFSVPHGGGLFFDPYLHVMNTGEEVHRGDIRLLSVPTALYMWPEERIRIDWAYPDITFIAGTPPTIIFPDFWWLHFNHCVYDGTPCTLPLGLPGGPVLQTTLTPITP
jgi:LruC domain-containing protein